MARAKVTIQPSGNYSVAKQEFLNSVVNKIGKQEYSSQVFLNPLKRFKGDFIDCASDIEEIYVARCEDTDGDDGKSVLDKVKSQVYTQYHTVEKDHNYKVTITDKDMRKGFLNKGGITTMANNLLDTMTTGSNIDEYEDILECLTALTNKKTSKNTIKLDPITDENTAKLFCKEVKKLIPKMNVWNDKYSSKPNFAPTNKLVLFIDSDVDVEVSTEYLASLFNMSVSELNNTSKVVVPNLKESLKGKQFAVLCDERCLKIHPTYYNIESIRNTRGKFTNYDLVINLLLSVTDWFQFAVFQEK